MQEALTKVKKKPTLIKTPIDESKESAYQKQIKEKKKALTITEAIINNKGKITKETPKHEKVFKEKIIGEMIKDHKKKQEPKLDKIIKGKIKKVKMEDEKKKVLPDKVKIYPEKVDVSIEKALKDAVQKEDLQQVIDDIKIKNNILDEKKKADAIFEVSQDAQKQADYANQVHQNKLEEDRKHELELQISLKREQERLALERSQKAFDNQELNRQKQIIQKQKQIDEYYTRQAQQQKQQELNKNVSGVQTYIKENESLIKNIPNFQKPNHTVFGQGSSMQKALNLLPDSKDGQVAAALKQGISDSKNQKNGIYSTAIKNALLEADDKHGWIDTAVNWIKQNYKPILGGGLLIAAASLTGQAVIKHKQFQEIQKIVEANKKIVEKKKGLFQNVMYVIYRVGHIVTFYYKKRKRIKKMISDLFNVYKSLSPLERVSTTISDIYGNMKSIVALTAEHVLNDQQNIVDALLTSFSKAIVNIFRGGVDDVGNQILKTDRKMIENIYALTCAVYSPILEKDTTNQTWIYSEVLNAYYDRFILKNIKGPYKHENFQNWKKSLNYEFADPDINKQKK